MKIINQTENFLSLKEGNISVIIFGLLFFMVGIGAGYILLNSSNKAIVSWLVSIVFVVVGILVFFLSYAIVIEFDKTSGQVAYQEKGIIRNKKVSYNISDIIRIEKRNGWRTETSTSNRFSTSRQIPMSQSFLIFKDGLILPIDREKSPSSGILVSVLTVNVLGRNKERNIANTIATFIGVPFQEVALPSDKTGINVGPIGGIQL